VTLSAVSHSAPLHLLFNLFALVSLGPTVERVLAVSASWPLWPLLLGSAVSGSVFFLAFGGSGGACMGLSGVTLALLSVYARFVPDRVMGTLIGGIIPLRMPAMQLVTMLTLWSIVGMFLASAGGFGRGGRRSQVAHATHLGGLMFGLLYYELLSRRHHLKRMVRKTQHWIDQNRSSLKVFR
jgi:rhomboid-like protein